jgi:hypothetical protein
MDSKLTLTVFFALATYCVVSVAAGEEEKMPGVEVTEQVVDQKGELTNDTITWCNTDAKGKCECSKDLPTEAPASSAPENACVKINVAMGHARYSALTKSIMLQLNELVPNSALYSPSGFVLTTR